MLIEETIDRDSQQKLYVQIHQIIKGKIEKGEWTVGKLIPSEDELCKIFDVSKATVRLAIYELVRTGYLKRQQGKGTFVTYSGSHFGIAMKTRLTEDLLSENIAASKEILQKEVRKPSGEIMEYLKQQDEVFYVSCKGFFENEPVYIEEFYLPLSLMYAIHNDNLCQNSLYELIQSKSMKKIFKIVQTIEVIQIDKDIAAELNLQIGCHALQVHSLLLSSDGAAIAYVKLTGSGKKYKIQTEFEKIR